MNPSLYQINTKVLLSTLGGNATLDDIPDTFLDSIASKGFDWIWLLGVWKIGPTGREISRSRIEWHTEYRAALSDLTQDDICGSPFAIAEYTVDPSLGGDIQLARLRGRLEQRGIKLLLDFVPNHIGFDHRFASERPDFLIQGTEADLAHASNCWTRLPNGTIAAFGRDPNYPGWPDTLQLNYFNADLRAAMIADLRNVASKCSGVRCDMAMLLEPEVFHRTWGGRPESKAPLTESFWPEAIATVRRDTPNFLFLAEVYWDYEARLQEHGFDYTYDKTLYDRLIHHEAAKVFEHLSARGSYRGRMAHFLENHDEPRIATQLAPNEHRAAAVISFLAPGLRFLHHGECEGNRARIPVHLKRGPNEETDPAIAAMYSQLIPIINSPASKYGGWHILRCAPAWEGNPTHANFIAYYIAHELEDLLITVNYASYRGQCLIQLPQGLPNVGTVKLIDKLSHVSYERTAQELSTRGLFLDVDGYATHIFSVQRT